mgnify:CR=1 FL=1
MSTSDMKDQLKGVPAVHVNVQAGFNRMGTKSADLSARISSSESTPGEDEQNSRDKNTSSKRRHFFGRILDLFRRNNRNS